MPSQVANLLAAGCISSAMPAAVQRLWAARAKLPAAGYQTDVLRLDVHRDDPTVLEVRDVRRLAAVATGLVLREVEGPVEPFLNFAAKQAMEDSELVGAIVSDVQKALDGILMLKGMPAICRKLLFALRRCEDLTNLAEKNGALLDSDAVLSSYMDPPGGVVLVSGEPERCLLRALGHVVQLQQVPDHALVEVMDSLAFMAMERAYVGGSQASGAQQ